jgi:hypothetical protein
MFPTNKLFNLRGRRKETPMRRKTGIHSTVLYYAFSASLALTYCIMFFYDILSWYFTLRLNWVLSTLTSFICHLKVRNRCPLFTLQQCTSFSRIFRDVQGNGSCKNHVKFRLETGLVLSVSQKV